MAEEILSKKAPFQDVALLIVFALPSIIATSAPFSALVGTLMGVGRLVSDREVLSMNALGVSARFIAVPVIAVGLLISVASFLTNDILLPLGTIKFNRLYRKILTSVPALELEANAIKKSQRAIVVTGPIKDQLMDGILVIDSDEEGNKRIVSAPRARVIKSNDLDVLMTLTMDEAQALILDKGDKQQFDYIGSQGISYNLLAKNVIPSYSTRITPREMSSRDLYAEISKMREDEKKGGDASRGKTSRTLNMYRMEFHKKFTIPFGALFFVILAFPLASAKTNGQSVGFISGLIIAVLYWSLLVSGQTLSVKLGFNGALVMWLPNLLVFAAGTAMLWRHWRE
jgi:lipopolysaccharide export system permease protein